MNSGGFRIERHGADVAESDAEPLVERRHLDERAMKIDRGIVPGIAREAHDALRLSEPVCANEMRALGIARERGEEAADLALRGLVSEHRQRKRRFRHEHVAGNAFERGARGIGRAFVIAGDDGPLSLPFEHNLRGAEHVPGGDQTNSDAAEVARLAVCRRFEAPRAVHAEPELHYLDGFGRRQHGVMPGARMIAVSVRDDGAGNGAGWIDVDVGGCAIEPAVRWVEPLIDAGRTHERKHPLIYPA
ncbi:hypothetical protein W911_10720 [Hyphomicrobium nitrativorans NL23]|uniref:Uncharacterized protein n=1 Tax=Hyphomicrobium nitrativorans NL23 TaxID=1029756 RepID=V5SJQ0_9HYPH|nr:hypothetical protein W911_10720 [Hyphomicrobium nitrativorans NL23]